jgi:transposase-like protein
MDGELMSELMPEKRRRLDWETIEREYRAGQLSVHEIARQHGCSHVVILKWAKRRGWIRDLSGKVRREVSTRLVTDLVTATVTGNMAETLELAARRGVEVVRSHRALIKRLLDISQKLMDEMDQGELKPFERNDRFRSLAQGLAKLIPLERQAFALDEDRGKLPVAGQTSIQQAFMTVFGVQVAVSQIDEDSDVVTYDTQALPEKMG